MSERSRDMLRVVISVALAMAPKRLRGAYLGRHTEAEDAARRDLSGHVANAVLDHFEVSRKQNEIGISASTHLLTPRDEE